MQVPDGLFRPSSGLNETLERLYQGNLFCVVRQLYKRITDDKDFGRFFYDWLFGRFRDNLTSKEAT